MSNDCRPIIIIGMHRSGTSMLTRFLQESGIFMGKEKGMNDEAFFFQKINDWILYQAGTTWDNPYNMRFINDYFINHISKAINTRLSSIWIKQYLGAAKAIKYRNIRHLDLTWGWKDPRNTLALPVWRAVFPEARIIHIYRNPIDVAASLRKREYNIEKNYKQTFRKMKREWLLAKKPIYYQSSRVHDIYEGVKLWEEYVNSALAADNYYDHVIHIKYEDFLKQPHHILHQLSEFLSLQINTKLISSISQKINSSRSFAFINDTELIDVYNTVRNNPLVNKLGYSKIIPQKPLR